MRVQTMRGRTKRGWRRTVAAVAAAAALTTSVGGCGLLDKGAYDLPLPGGADVGDDPTTMTIHFTDVEGLVPKSNVKLDNVAVGKVTSIDVETDDWSAVVTAEVRSDLGLPADVEARVRRSSLLGEWYVELVRPEAGTSADAVTLSSATTIPIDRTGGTADVEEVLGALSLLLNNGGLPQINTIMTELNTALGGNESQVRALLGDLTEFTSQLDARRDDIVRALDGLDRLTRVLRDNDDKIATALEELPAGLEVLADQRPQLVALLRSLDRLSEVTVRVVEQSKDDTVADLKLLAPVLRGLEQSGGDLAEALKIFATFPFTPGAMGAIAGDYANLDAKVDFDLDAVVGTLLNSNQPINLGGQDLPNPLPILRDPLSILDDLVTVPEVKLPDAIKEPVRDLTQLLVGLLGGGRS